MRFSNSEYGMVSLSTLANDRPLMSAAARMTCCSRSLLIVRNLATWGAKSCRREADKESTTVSYSDLGCTEGERYRNKDLAVRGDRFDDELGRSM